VQNDTYRTLGPAPTGENTKRKQLEYDALGRMTSVCEITTATGSGSCAQTSAVTGYWTQYTYDVLNNLVGVTQNAQSSGSEQTRTYVYDDLGRLTSETNPEAATTTYTYDTDSTCGTSKGDLVKKIDAVGNTTCYAYDALHRVTGTTFSGPYAANTPSRYFVYDAATVNSAAMANAKTRLAEAYTCVSPCSSKITDLGFSYTVLGQPTDVYESTTHSGGYYHVTGTYYANGAINKLSNLVGLPAITYGVDGEGRVYSASAASGQNPLTSTTYNTASLPTQVNLGSSDSDSYTFDPNTNRMTQYKFSVNGQSVVGTLTWNPIATLETLAITDPFYGAGNQTCSYAHDDMSRIASVNCGSPWNQTFSYDAFGNISKSGTISFQPTYSYVTNRMTQIGSSTPTYDANGNVLNDTAHTYTWDATGRPVTIDTVGLTYDALGRMVEQNTSGVYTEIAYGPTGNKLAIMSGQTLQKGFVPLAGGSVAVYNSSGLAYYRHSDWLASSRLASTPTRTIYYDGAYAPFGESYAQTGTTDLSFTGMNQDTVANLFDFPAREYNAVHGRWPSPDPAGLVSVQPGDPQTLNRYTYVRDSPLYVLDPSGMLAIDCDDGITDCFDDGGGDGGGGGGSSGDCPPGVICVVTNQPLPQPDPPPGDGGGDGGSGDGDCPYGVICVVTNQPLLPPGGNTNAGGANNGFTLGIRAPGQTWSQCMAANANTYSIGGATELTVNVATGTNSNISQSTSIVTGNGITGLIFEGPGAGDFLNAAGNGAGSALTYGRRTSDIMSLNLAGSGGLPQALGSTGAQGFFETAGQWLNLGLDEAEKFAVDAGLAGAEAFNCAIHR
jgi:RHS repeat-associated protein